MDRLAKKMIEIAEAEKMLEMKRINPFSKANQVAHQQKAPQVNPFTAPNQRQQIN
jgi:hypothetical protein